MNAIRNLHFSYPASHPLPFAGDLRHDWTNTWKVVASLQSLDAFLVEARIQWKFRHEQTYAQEAEFFFSFSEDVNPVARLQVFDLRRLLLGVERRRFL